MNSSPRFPLVVDVQEESWICIEWKHFWKPPVNRGKSVMLGVRYWRQNSGPMRRVFVLPLPSCPQNKCHRKTWQLIVAKVFSRLKNLTAMIVRRRQRRVSTPFSSKFKNTLTIQIDGVILSKWRNWASSQRRFAQHLTHCWGNIQTP